MKALREKVFRGWPTEREAGPLDVDRAFTAEADGVRLMAYDFNSQPHVRLRLFVVSATTPRDPDHVALKIMDETRWTRWLAAMRGRFEDRLGIYNLPDPDPVGARETEEMLRAAPGVSVYVCPRGVGADSWTGDEKKQTQIRRRFMLLGQTLDGMRVWDVRQAIRALGQIEETRGMVPSILADRNVAGVALFAALFEPQIAHLYLFDLPTTHRDGPAFLNVLRFLDMPQAVALAAEHAHTIISGQNASAWQFPAAVAKGLEWGRYRVQPIGEARFW
jgi:hypothetical protein